jgi:hypothetical protein
MFVLYAVTPSGTYQTSIQFATLGEATILRAIHEQNEDHLQLRYIHAFYGVKHCSWDDAISFLKDWPD